MRWGIFFLMLLGMLLLGCGAERGRGSARDGRTVDLRPAPRPGVVYEILHRETRQVDDEPPRVIETRTLAEVLEVRPDGSRAMRARIFREYRNSDDEPQLHSGVVQLVLSSTGQLADAQVACGDDAELRVSRYLAHVLGARAVVANGVGEGSRWRGDFLSDATELVSPATFRLDRIRPGRLVEGRLIARVRMEEGDVGGVRMTGEGRVRGRFRVGLRDGFSGRTDLRGDVRGRVRRQSGRARPGRLRTRTQIIVRRTADEVEGMFDCVFDPTRVTAYIRENLAAIQACYHRAQQQDPDLRGRVVMRFALQPDGRVTGAHATEDEIPSSGVAACLADVMNRFQLPAGAIGGPVHFAYPFVFLPHP